MDKRQKLIITKWKKGIISMLLENEKDVELHYDEISEIQVGNIYIAKVKDIVKSINAAFVEVIPGKKCYLSFENVRQPLYLNRLNPNAKALLVQGDEILVQVIKEQMKTKDAVVTTELSFAGQYIVLSLGTGQIGVSAKLTDTKREQLKSDLHSYVPTDVNIIVRTNAQYANTDEIVAELKMLNHQLKNMIDTAKHRTCYSVMRQAPNKYLTLLRDLKWEQLSTIVTDDEEIFHTLNSQEYLQNEKGSVANAIPVINYYHDTLLPLVKFYSIESRVDKALSTRVWLKSGGYLVIEHTEALTAIDVNTGRFDCKMNQQEAFQKINLEAAKEVARQLRLRNLSGIIIVDFINMDDIEKQYTLINELRSYVKEDRVKTEVHDMTQLQLIEITRKKSDRPLYEVIRDIDM